MFYKEGHRHEACGWGYNLGEFIHHVEEEVEEVVEEVVEVVEDFVEEVIKELRDTIDDLKK